MRNVDKIKSLEKELGKYQKKVADQGKLLRKLRDELERSHAGAIQLQAAAAGSNRASAPEARERGDYARAVITELLQMREEWRHANCPGN